MIKQSLQELYSAKSDEELLMLAADSASLTEDAKSLLALELQRRNLKQPPIHQKTGSPTAEFRPPWALVFVGALLLNTFVALLGTPLLEAGSWRIIHPHFLAAFLWKWWILDFLCAAGLGFSICRLWRTKAAVWTWVLPVLWFTFRFVPVALSGRSQSILLGRSVWSQFSGSECFSGLQSLGCRNFFLFTLPLVRGVSYSLGAQISSMLTSQYKGLQEVAAGTSMTAHSR